MKPVITKALSQQILSCTSFQEVTERFSGPMCKEALNHWMHSLPARYRESLFFSNPDNLTGEGVAQWYEDAGSILSDVIAEYGNGSREEAVYYTYVFGFIERCKPEALEKATAEMTPHLLENWNAVLTNLK
ncbi:hypothetical protein [Pseudomonas sp. p1(2021b)]|uniref:hypothetical protein n=1 Tax=Pseudomonas sp. p1(2021b) TaxID=2874628 RepID=UPI003D28A17C